MVHRTWDRILFTDSWLPGVGRGKQVCLWKGISLGCWNSSLSWPGGDYASTQVAELYRPPPPKHPATHTQRCACDSDEIWIKSVVARMSIFWFCYWIIRCHHWGNWLRVQGAFQYYFCHFLWIYNYFQTKKLKRSYWRVHGIDRNYSLLENI